MAHADRLQTVRSIEEKFGLTPWDLRKAIKSLGWAPRTPWKPGKARRRPLVGRMLELLESHVARLEDARDKAGNADAELLTRLVGTLGKLRDMQKAEGAMAKARSSAEMIDIRNKLVQRIEDLKRR